MALVVAYTLTSACDPSKIAIPGTLDRLLEIDRRGELPIKGELLR